METTNFQNACKIASKMALARVMNLKESENRFERYDEFFDAFLNDLLFFDKKVNNPNPKKTLEVIKSIPVEIEKSTKKVVKNRKKRKYTRRNLVANKENA